MTRVSLYNIKQRSPPLHATPDRLFPTPNNDHPSPPKTRSPISSNQTAIAPSTPITPIAYSSKSNNNHSSPPTKPDRLFPQIKQRLPLTLTKPDRLFPQIKQRSPPHHPQNPIAYSLNIKQRFLVVKAAGENSNFIV